MKTYPKIETLFNRDEKFKVIDGAYRRPEFEAVDSWIVTEKVDGTNIRIEFNPAQGGWRIGGRSDNAQIPVMLLHKLNAVAMLAAPEVSLICKEHNLETLTLFGEGYGAKIQNGGWYREDQGFILFDVLVDDQSWLDWTGIFKTAERLGINRVPVLGCMSTVEATEFARGGFASDLTSDERNCEGIVARPITELYDRRGHRVMWKLKYSDFER